MIIFIKDNTIVGSADGNEDTIAGISIPNTTKVILPDDISVRINDINDSLTLDMLKVSDTGVAIPTPDEQKDILKQQQLDMNNSSESINNDLLKNTVVIDELSA